MTTIYRLNCAYEDLYLENQLNDHALQEIFEIYEDIGIYNHYYKLLKNAFNYTAIETKKRIDKCIVESANYIFNKGVYDKEAILFTRAFLDAYVNNKNMLQKEQSIITSI